MRQAREPVLILLLYLAVATALGYADYKLPPYRDLAYTKIVPAILDGTESAPARYRVLASYTYEGVRRLTGWSPLNAWTLFRWLCLFASLLSAHLYFSTWFRPPAAVA